PLHARGAMGGTPLARTQEHLLMLLLAADPTLAEDLVAHRLTPLGRLPGGTRARAEATLRAWFDAHGDVSATAALLHVHPQTARTWGAISLYRLLGRSGKQWCSIWKLRLPLMR